MVAINDHQPVPVGTATMITTAQMDELKSFLSELHAKQLEQPPAVLSEAQFTELTRLLQPGYDLSTAMLADYKRQTTVAVPKWDGVGPLPNNSPDKEWRTQEEIAAGTSYFSDRAEVTAARLKV